MGVEGDGGSGRALLPTRVADIEHVGSAHDEAELAMLEAPARQRLAAGQGELDLGLSSAGWASGELHQVDGRSRYRLGHDRQHGWGIARLGPGEYLPSSLAQPEALLIDVVDRLIHETLSERIDSWHYFWEYDPIKMHHLRLRVLWRPGQGREGRTVLARHLDEAEASGCL